MGSSITLVVTGFRRLQKFKIDHYGWRKVLHSYWSQHARQQWILHSYQRDSPWQCSLWAKEKFPLKVLVWIVISERGITKPLIRPSKAVAVHSAIYIKECLEKRLLPFINIPSLSFLCAKVYQPPNVPQACLSKIFGVVYARKCTRKVWRENLRRNW